MSTFEIYIFVIINNNNTNRVEINKEPLSSESQNFVSLGKAIWSSFLL